MEPNEVRGIRVLAADGSFGAPVDVRWVPGRIEVRGSAPHGAAGPGNGFVDAGLWMIPGLVDAHAHLSWHAFDKHDRAALATAETAAATAAACARTLAAGFTSVRDAGGLSAADAEAIPVDRRPRLQTSQALLDRAAADAAGGLDRAVERVLAAGANWVKLVATASVASPPGAGLEPVFAAAEVRDAVRRADAAGAGVMVHAWGGAAIDDAIEAGAMSIEHGIFLTDAQARRAAERGMTLVPTLRIYRLVQRMIDEGSLPAAFRARVDEAVGAHPRAVLRARDAGLALAVGTDSGSPDQHGSGAHEIDALVAAGLTAEEALVAATRGGAELLARVRGAGDAVGEGSPGHAEAAGVGAARGVGDAAGTGSGYGFAAGDAVILRRDPREPGALADPDAIVAVLLGGRPVDLEALRAAGSLAPALEPDSAPVLQTAPARDRDHLWGVSRSNQSQHNPQAISNDESEHNRSRKEPQ